MSGQSPLSSERRSFVTYLNAGVASLAAIALGSTSRAQGESTTSPHWEPALPDKDNWLDKQSAKHRLIFDTTRPAGFGEALVFAGNFLLVNRSDYGLKNEDLAVVIVVRHLSTPFGYNDAIWAKYGATIAALAEFEDPKTKLAPKANLYNAADYGNQLHNLGVTIDSLTKQGVLLAVCSMATRRIAGAIAKAAGSDAEAVNGELTANLVGNARMAPAGIVAVNRAQERGYSVVTS
jgi:intracellular sulfur oxidation DsrE/DsrF family protein